MPRWPWPDVEVEYFTTKALRVMNGHPRRVPLVTGFLRYLVLYGDPATSEPVVELRAWAKRQPVGRLRNCIEHAAHTEHAALAEKAGGLALGRRQGDAVVRGPRQPRLPWWDMRAS